MDEVSIRRGQEGDVPLLAEMGAETFIDAYVEDIEAEMLREFVAESFGLAQQGAEMADRAVLFLIAETADEAVGYALLREGVQPQWGLPAEMGAGKAVELGRIYARKAWIGCGVGSALMRACLDEARARGCDVMWLGVWERNEQALAFYRKWGFVEIGDQVFMMGDERQRDVVMARMTADY